MQQNITKILVASILVLPFIGGGVASAAAPAWDVEGTYEIAFNFGGTNYTHEMSLTQDVLGNLDGVGGYPVGVPTYTWDITSGSVSENAIDFFANYTAPISEVTPVITVMHVVGTIALDGTMSGTWSDNSGGLDRTGTFATTEGLAIPLTGTLAAQDFGVVNYDTGLGMLKGYTAGFGLVDATFENVQSVVVELYSGATLLQTNTATAKVGMDITGANISSPFDVSGTFDYATDGYWVNTREAQFGQSVPATRVVATVTLENGKVVTAENTILAGDPTTIYTDDFDEFINKNQCKNHGWELFTNPFFKNQGQCIKYMVHQDNDDDDNDRKSKKSHNKVKSERRSR
jgi:hypothetical protein